MGFNEGIVSVGLFTGAFLVNSAVYCVFSEMDVQTIEGVSY